MKHITFFIITIILFSCGSKTFDKETVPGRIADMKWFFPNKDSLLWIYSIYSSEHTEYSSSSANKSSTYSHENSLFTLFRLKKNTLQFVRQGEASCINHQQCGTRYIDKIIAYSSSLLAFKCECEGKMIIIDIATGQNWSDLKGLKEKFKECSAGITKYSSFPARPDIIELELNDGKVLYLSLETKKMIEWDNTFDFGTEVNRGSIIAHISGKKIYFAPNDGDHRSFLVVRAEKSGTSQDYKHQMGKDFWLNPLLLNKINDREAYVKENTFYVLHSKVWNDYQDRDLLSKINIEGKTLYTIELKGLGTIFSYVASDNFLYITNKKGIHIYDTESGKKIKWINFEQIKNISNKTI